jgi:hypothetical protein
LRTLARDAWRFAFGPLLLTGNDLMEKFTDQTDEDYRAMKEELDRVLDLVRHRGGRVIREPEEVQGFAEEVDRKLPSLVESQKVG